MSDAQLYALAWAIGGILAAAVLTLADIVYQYLTGKEKR